MSFDGCLTVVGRSTVCQSACLTQFLEDDTVHTTSKIFVEECLDSCLFRIPCAVLIVIHHHVDILRIIRRDHNLIGGCLLLLILFVDRYISKFLDGLVVGGDQLRQGSLALWSVIHHGVLVVGDIL